MTGTEIISLVWCAIVFGALGVVIWDDIKARRNRNKGAS